MKVRSAVRSGMDRDLSSYTYTALPRPTAQEFESVQQYLSQRPTISYGTGYSRAPWLRWPM
jgi:hypothetical protein